MKKYDEKAIQLAVYEEWKKNGCAEYQKPYEKITKKATKHLQDTVFVVIHEMRKQEVKMHYKGEINKNE
nr:MAG TPA: hypothetical protein [Caudoviricetes sp.]